MYTLKQISPVLNGTLVGNDVTFTGVSTDSRTINPGELFVALVGEKFNGHEYIAQAQERGAVAALVNQPLSAKIPYVQVGNTLTALGVLASWHRDHFSIPVIALTGSCGKTTVKTMIGSILQQMHPTLASIGNLNNAIGLPLSLLKLTQEHHYAVLEMGADHAGEIAYLCNLVRPQIALITCVRPVHVEGFGSLDGIANAKAEIYQSLPKDGVAIINQDEKYSAQWHALLPTQSIITFGLQGGMVTAKNIHINTQGYTGFTLCMGDEQFPISLRLLGEHNVLNALAAAAAAWGVGVPVEAIQAGLLHVQPVKGRLVPRPGQHGSLILDDHYNSNPAALQAALSILSGYPGTKIAILGDMLELGPTTQDIHEVVAEWLQDAGVQQFFGYGNLMKYAVQQFGPGAQHFATHEELTAAVLPLLAPEVTVLIKGSRGMKMENVV
ncbi:MAG: UDP-N-acetylmuramoyl-tripeptide--D-alanyl-D-alanine ligase, partial [Gammaproteobacteria bacterium]